MSGKKMMIAGAAAAVLVSAAGVVPAQATPGRYTPGGNVTVTVTAWGGCATVYYPRGGSDAFCGSESWQQFGIVPGDRFGGNVVSYSGASVSCRVVDNSSGDTVWADYGYAGGAALCMRTANR